MKAVTLMAFLVSQIYLNNSWLSNSPQAIRIKMFKEHLYWEEYKDEFSSKNATSLAIMLVFYLYTDSVRIKVKIKGESKYLPLSGGHAVKFHFRESIYSNWEALDCCPSP